MNDDTDNPRRDAALAPWLAAARANLRTRRAPEWVESRLLMAAAEQRTLQALGATVPAAESARVSPRPWWRRAWIAPALAGSAAFVVGIAALTMQPVAIAPAVASPAPFIALTSMDAIEAETAPQIVAAQMPRAALAGFGLPVDPARADQPVQTEVLMSPRGVVLAVRFVE
jgi:hypothetical protein